MLRKLLLATLSLSVSIISFAQPLSPSEKTEVKQESPNDTEFVYWKATDEGCRSEYSDGRLYRTIKHKDLTITVTLAEEDKMVAWVGVKNKNEGDDFVTPQETAWKKILNPQFTVLPAEKKNSQAGTSISSALTGVSVPAQKRSAQQLPVLTPEQIVREAMPSIVLVSAGTDDRKATGSGFVIVSAQKSCLIVTNYHVIANAEQIAVKLVGNKTFYPVKEVILQDSEMDLAILKVDGLFAPRLTYIETLPAVGSQIYVIGNPRGLEGSLSAGLVSAIRGEDLIQITAPISPGSSGSPVLDGHGRVIGVAVGAKEDGQNLNFAVPAVWITRLAERDERKSGTVSNNKRTVSSSLTESERERQALTVLEKATELFKGGDLNGAIRLAEKALNVWSEGELLKQKLAFYYAINSYRLYDLGLYEDALGEIRKVLNLTPNNPDLFGLMSRCYRSLKKPAAALAAAKQAVRLKPDDPIGHFDMASSYEDLGDYTEAILAANRAIALDPYGQKDDLSKSAVSLAYQILAHIYLFEFHDSRRAYQLYQEWRKCDRKSADEWWNKFGWR